MSDAAKEGEDRETVGEGTVRGDQVSIPPAIRERADIEDGDTLRWRWENGDLTVEVVQHGVFEDFQGFDAGRGDVTAEHAGLLPAGEWDVPDE